MSEIISDEPPTKVAKIAIDEERKLPPGTAPIKREYLLPQKPRFEKAGDQNEKVQTRGQFKSRPKPFKEEFKLCRAFVIDGSCAFGDKCKFAHDVDEYLAKKLPDISGPCPFWRRCRGFCKYGPSCRMYKTHLLMSPEELEQYPTVQDPEMEESNQLTKELQRKLRKKQYDFKMTRKVVGDSKHNRPRKSEEVPANSDQPDPIGSAGADRERKQIDWNDKLYLAPLTTVGNLPFRRICKRLGADITCGEMAMASNLLQGHNGEWALVRRHESEDIFGIQLCGNQVDMMARCAEMLGNETNVDFIDINCGCPIDLVFKAGSGSALMDRKTRLRAMINAMSKVTTVPITAKLRTGILEKQSVAHKIIPGLFENGAQMVAIHGRSREQRYTKLASWDYIRGCAEAAGPGNPIYGNGDILSFEDALHHKERSGVSGLMIARGALIKPWIFKEIKEQKHWDISSSERWQLIEDYAKFGLEHWGSDTQGVERTRRFLLEWMSFLYRYIPIGLLERLPPKINERPLPFFGRDDLETKMASPNCKDWIEMTERILGPAPEGFEFLPKHRANAYANS